QQHGPSGSGGGVETQRLEARLNGRRGLRGWEEVAEGNTVGRGEQETEKDTVHERDIGEVEFRAHGRAIVVVPPEGNTVARGRKFTDKGRRPANQPDPPDARA